MQNEAFDQVSNRQDLAYVQSFQGLPAIDAESLFLTIPPCIFVGKSSKLRAILQF
jgi:hypothetical protein